MSGDWIKLHRKLINSPIFQDQSLFRLWTWCLFRANWKSNKVLIPGTRDEVTLQRGQFLTGRNAMHKELYGPGNWKPSDKNDRSPSARTLYRWLQKLESMGCITLSNLSNRCTIVTVCNYGTYQDDNRKECPTVVQPVSNQCPTSVPPLSTEEEKKERKKGNNKIDLGDFDFEIALCDIQEIGRLVNLESDGNLMMACRAAVLKQSSFSEHWFRDCIGSIRSCSPQNPAAYLHEVFARSATGIEFDLVRVPQSLIGKAKDIRARPPNGIKFEVGELLKSAPKE